MGLIFLLLAGVGLSLPGCSKQGEGERCSRTANNDEDCDEGLICKQDKLDPDFGRCCPPEGAEVSDSRCNSTSTPVSTGGSSSGGSSSGGSSSGGSSSGGTPGSSEGGAAPNAGAGGNDEPTATGGAGGSGG